MLARSYYQANIADFLEEDPDKVLGELAHNHHFALDISQKNAWLEQIEHLKQNLARQYSGKIFFEFSVPRMGKRVDVVLLINNVVFVLEYKAGAKKYDRYAMDQALDYALDLKNFHEGSHGRYIVPILVSTKAARQDNILIRYQDKVAAPLLCSNNDLNDIIALTFKDLKPGHTHVCGLSDNEQEPFGEQWEDSGYKPTPTIVEAAQALYQGHKVEEISRSDAGAKNLPKY